MQVEEEPPILLKI